VGWFSQWGPRSQNQVPPAEGLKAGMRKWGCEPPPHTSQARWAAWTERALRGGEGTLGFEVVPAAVTLSLFGLKTEPHTLYKGELVGLALFN
jgi:hypothetical protein